MQRSISSGRSRVLGIRMRSRVSSMRRLLRTSLLPLVAVIAPFHRQLAPGARQQTAALAVIFPHAEKLSLGHFAVFVDVEVERNDTFFPAGPVELAGVVHKAQELRAIEGLAELNVAHVPGAAGKEAAC